MGKFFKTANPVARGAQRGLGWVGRKMGWIKKNPTKAGAGAAGWVLEPGVELANLTGYGDRVKDNNLIEDFIFFGYPVGDVIYDAVDAGSWGPGETRIGHDGKKYTRPYCDNWPGGCKPEAQRIKQKVSSGKGPTEIRPLDKNELPR